MALSIDGYVEVTASLFDPGVLEDAFRRFLTTDPVIIFARNPADVLGRVTKIGGRGDRVEISAELEPPSPGTVTADAYNKVKSGTIKGLSIEGAFSSDRAVISAVSISPLTPVVGTGFVTSVSGES
jgi:phage head maturation protease